MRTIKLTEETRKDLLEKLLKRSPNCYGEYEGRVTEIVNTVRAEDVYKRQAIALTVSIASSILSAMRMWP